jgi:hypothetical protein
MIFDWDSDFHVGTSPLVVVDWGNGVVVTVAPPEVIDYLYLHASITSTLYHAESTTGESTPITIQHNLVDEAENNLVDELGNQIIVFDSDSAILFHAKETDTLYHAER